MPELGEMLAQQLNHLLLLQGTQMGFPEPASGSLQALVAPASDVFLCPSWAPTHMWQSHTHVHKNDYTMSVSLPGLSLRWKKDVIFSKLAVIPGGSLCSKRSHIAMIYFRSIMV